MTSYTLTEEELKQANNSAKLVSGILEKAQGKQEIEVEGVLISVKTLLLFQDILFSISEKNKKQNLSLIEVADLLNVSPEYCEKLIQEGVLKAQNIEGKQVVDSQEVLDYKKTVQQTRQENLTILAEEAQKLGLGY